MQRMIAMVFAGFLVAVGAAHAQSQAQAPRSASQTDYVIAAQDVLKIEVCNEEDLSNLERRVSATGEISFPLLSTVHVAGKSPAQMEKQLAAALDEISPTVSVTVFKCRTCSVAVLGQVGKPGAVNLPGEGQVTIMEAIALAGGLAKLASGSIEFSRNGQHQRLDLHDLKKETVSTKIIYVQEGDIINLRESRF